MEPKNKKKLDPVAFMQQPWHNNVDYADYGKRPFDFVSVTAGVLSAPLVHRFPKKGENYNNNSKSICIETAVWT